MSDLTWWLFAQAMEPKPNGGREMSDEKERYAKGRALGQSISNTLKVHEDVKEHAENTQKHAREISNHAREKEHPGRWPVDMSQRLSNAGTRTNWGKIDAESIHSASDYILQVEKEVGELDTERIHWMELYEGLERERDEAWKAFFDAQVKFDALFDEAEKIRIQRDAMQKENAELKARVVLIKELRNRVEELK